MVVFCHELDGFLDCRILCDRQRIAAHDVLDLESGQKVVDLIGAESRSRGRSRKKDVLLGDYADKVLVLEDIEIMGVTALGIHEDGSEVREGMQGARLDIADFSMENNSIHFAQKDIDIISEFMTTLKQYIEESKSV